MTALRFTTTTLAAAAALTLWAGGAQAAVHTLNLTGLVADGHYSSQDVGADHFDQWVLSLSGLDAITVEQGDTIEATITLDQLFTIPGSMDRTSFAFILGGALFPAGDQTSSGSTSFFNGMDLVKSGAGGTGTSGQIAHAVTFFPPDNGPITFDSITTSFVIDTIGGPAALDYALISYTLVDLGGAVAAVPEPGAWAMMIMGFGGMGAVIRRRRGAAFA